MDYVRLGRAGVKVSRLALGTAQFGGAVPREDALALIDKALAGGINFIDTADAYAEGRSEEIVGEALRVGGRRDQVVLATKVHFPVGPGPNDRGNSHYHIVRQCESSLRRLGTDRIDLYYLHRPDPDTSLEESMRALDDVVRQGKVLYLGTSHYPAWQIMEGLWISDRHALAPFVCDQPSYSLLERGPERELLPFAAATGFGVVAHSPLAGGLLTGKYRPGQPPPEGSRAARNPRLLERLDDRALRTTEQVRAIAEHYGATAGQVALAWVLGHPALTAAIIGPRTAEQLEDNLGAAELRLSDDERARLESGRDAG